MDKKRKLKINPDGAKARSLIKLKTLSLHFFENLRLNP